MTLLTPKQVAQMLQVSTSTLRGWRKQRKGPPVIELGPGTFRYPEQQLQEYIQSKIGQGGNNGTAAASQGR